MSVIRGAALLVAAATLAGCAPAPASAVETVQIVVPTRDLAPGEVLAAADLAVIAVPPEYVPEGVFRAAEEAMGDTVLEPIGKGEPLRRERLARNGLSGLDALTPTGMVRARVPLVDTTDLYAPGRYVDIVSPARGCVVSQALKVVAVETPAGPSLVPAVATALFVLVTPEWGARLDAALADGPIAVAMRGDIDVARSSAPECP